MIIKKLSRKSKHFFFSFSFSGLRTEYLETAAGYGILIAYTQFPLFAQLRKKRGCVLTLSDLAAYAEKKYHIREQRKWSDFPGFSVLADPETEKWVALLIRQKDFSTGANVERCDIKCGRQTLQEISASFLSPPFRMKGQKWVGVTIDRNTDPDVVFRLLDRAVTSGEQRGYTIVLDNNRKSGLSVYSSSPLPSFPTASAPIDADIPEPIGEMLRLYEYGDGSFRQKCENFYRQGKFMEQYEDNAPWTGQYLHYFPTYHDLNLRQLRGYFTWRTHLRKGEYPSSATSFAFLYLYELLNEIGTSSPEDSLRKMRDFETGYLDSGIGDPGIRKNLHRWMLEFSVVRNIPLDSALLYIPREDLEADRFLAVLKMPEGSSDDDLFSALFYYSGKKETSSVYPADLESKRKHLVADAWRYACASFTREKKDLFSSVFGQQKAYSWHPLSNTVFYWERIEIYDREYTLNPCRSYFCHNGIWQEKKYEKLYFDLGQIQSFWHEADRQIRKYMKVGHTLREKPCADWISSSVKAALEADRQAEIEASRPVITINLSGLDRIRQDALVTRDSLLTEEDSLPDQEPEDSAPSAVPGFESEQQISSLTPVQIRILRALLQGESAEAILKEQHMMPSIAADAINEALFDEIGDTVLECDQDTLSLIEDYREDISHLLGGSADA